MKPITFSCEVTISLSAEEIVGRILDVKNWPGFTGYGPIPGIRCAEFEVQNPELVGSRIRVTNLDGSSHVEEIMQWKPLERLQLRMQNFSSPLSHLAHKFDETWEFHAVDQGTRVRRAFQLHAKSHLSRLPLLAISFFLKRAVARHLREMT